MSKVKIYPSLISAPLLSLDRVIDQLEPHCDGFHIDVMDNHFVPNLTWGPAMVNALSVASKKPLYVHFMIENLLTVLSRIQLKEDSIVSFHYETEKDFNKIFNYIKENKLKSALAIHPKTPIKEIIEVARMFDQILLMSVVPGFSGQAFLPDSIQRLQELVKLRDEHNLDFEIAMDGGISEHNIFECVQNGATIFGVASAIFGKEDPVAALKNLYRAATGKQ